MTKLETKVCIVVSVSMLMLFDCLSISNPLTLFFFLDTKDYVILKILAEVCKVNSNVKVGSAILRPTSLESLNAFILSVTVSDFF